MKHLLSIFSVASILLIGSNSEALLSNTSSFDMDEAGYHCTSGQQLRRINITYHTHDLYLESCKVNYRKNTEASKTLWSDQRNSVNCENKAALMALRLEDRGWECQMAGI